MALAYKNNENQWIEWRPGSRLPSGLTPSRNAEQLMSELELEELGLYTIVVESIPLGKRSTAKTLTDVEGVPTYVHTLEDIPVPVPYTITRRQMILQLVAQELITPEEALDAATTGAVPAAVQAVFDNLEPMDQLAAEITWATMSVAERDNPLVAALAAANEMTDQDVDAFFINASQR